MDFQFNFNLPNAKDKIRVDVREANNGCSFNVYDDAHLSKNRVINRYGLALGLPEISLLDIMDPFNEQVEWYSYLGGASRAIDIALLMALARRYENCRYLEIGTFRGESIANVAKIASTCFSISLSEQEMRQKNLPAKFIDQHFMFCQDKKNIHVIRHNSQTFDFSYFTEPFDLIFIDGDHTYQGIKKDTENVFSLLKDDDSVLVWHDYTLSLDTIRWTTLAAILDGSREEHRSHLYHVKNTMCAVFMKQMMQAKLEGRFSSPDKLFSVNIAAESLR